MTFNTFKNNLTEEGKKSIININSDNFISVDNNSFCFDKVFGQNSTSKEIFENSCKNLINNILNENILSIFWSGYICTGKAMTMNGIIINTINENFKFDLSGFDLKVLLLNIKCCIYA